MLAFRSPYWEALAARVAELGGLHDAHLHLCRAHTLGIGRPGAPKAAAGGRAHLSLPQKHRLIGDLHASGAYDPEHLRARVGAAVDVMVQSGTTRAETVVDVTDDGLEFSALEAMTDLAAARRGEIDIRLAAYNPLGFDDANPRRWDLFETAAARTDFLGALPEADDHARYPERIGFEESLTRVLDLARRLGKAIHIHLDQLNLPEEGATETLLRVLARDGAFALPDGGTAVWAIHVISPSTYDEPRFARLVEGLRAQKVGVICCPSGALGMRQLRPRRTPTFNSIARVLDFLAAGIPVRLGSDNVADMCSPSTTANLYEEVFALSAALRFYDIAVLAKLAAAAPLDADDVARIQDHLQRDAEEVDLALQANRAAL